MMNKCDELQRRYAEILSKSEHQALLKEISGNPKFSRLHLSFVPDNYEQAAHKILIIGRETRGWSYKLPNQQYDLEGVLASMQASQKHFLKLVTRNSNLRGRSFFNFVRNVGKRSGFDGLIWANIFALDYEESHPKRLPLYPAITKLSGELLNALIDVMQPEIILFVTGGDGVEARRECFPNIRYSGEDTDGIPKHLLERFYFENSDVLCYRAPHPSATHEKRQHALKHLVSLLPKI